MLAPPRLRMPPVKHPVQGSFNPTQDACSSATLTTTSNATTTCRFQSYSGCLSLHLLPTPLDSSPHFLFFNHTPDAFLSAPLLHPPIPNPTPGFNPTQDACSSATCFQR